jgi:hypothetical protein
MVVLHQIVDAEADEPAVEEVVVELLQDVLVGVLGWATAHCVGCNVPTYDRPDALDLAARIEGSVPVIGGAISPEADTHLRPLSNRL